MSRLSDLPLPTRAQDEGWPRVVTLGGGHGQAALLESLSGLQCHLTAIVSVADDGGCSGKLRAELGMPPPGDVRRCLVSLATLKESAARFEERLSGGQEEGRCVGNLVLAEMRQDIGSLQKAVDWTAALLGCVGRVVPVAEEPGTLTVYDLVHGPLAGEAQIEKMSAKTLVATVNGPERASAEAKLAIERADLILIGPGSFVGSTLAVLTTGDVAEAVAAAKGRRILIRNISVEGHGDGQNPVSMRDHERILRDHLVIGGGDETVTIDALFHDPNGIGKRERSDGSLEMRAPVADESGRRHDPERLANALALFFDLERRPHTEQPRVSREAHAIFEHYLASARTRLASRLDT